MAKKLSSPRLVSEKELKLHPKVRRTILAVVFLTLAAIFILAGFQEAGPAGSFFFQAFKKVFGWGYYLLPAISFLIALSFIGEAAGSSFLLISIGGVLFLISGLGFIDLISPGSGGLTGSLVGAIRTPFGLPVSLILTSALLFISFLIVVNKPLRLPKRQKTDLKTPAEDEITIKEPLKINEPAEPPLPIEPKTEKISDMKIEKPTTKTLKIEQGVVKYLRSYNAPPLSLLITSVEKPTSGDLQAGANTIKRTLESFGIPVEMGEITVGPTITRYTLKPAEGVKLSKITALNQDLALALASHPIRIEAPIPGKSLVGIEVPNKSAALVRLGSLLMYPEFKNSSPLTFALGRNINGEPIFADIDKMPHMLIAGSTGAGKSILIHSLLISLLYKNASQTLRLILIDPKRVELSVYDGLPHLIAPVVTDPKKAMSVLRWAIQEMDKRYENLLQAGARDIKSYNKLPNHYLPYILIIIDELADLMVSYGREVEASIIRLAQMSRATGIHLIVSTQRPSVEIITGLIKANITCRIALQVASQIDSRTILDGAGAEKLLGNGDLLFISGELSKPRRIQGAFISEEEIKKVVDYIIENNPETKEIELEFNNNSGNLSINWEEIEKGEEDIDDELFEVAVETVHAAKKASASLLQRRLKIGYARAARLLDIMEEKKIIGPGEGAKPRQVFIK